MRLDSGELISADKDYKVSGWATVTQKSSGKPIWDVVFEYLTDQQTLRIKKNARPKLLNVEKNPGYERV